MMDLKLLIIQHITRYRHTRRYTLEYDVNSRDKLFAYFYLARIDAIPILKLCTDSLIDDGDIKFSMTHLCL